MILRLKSAPKLWIILFVLCLTAIAQSNAVALQHEAHHSTEHCCLLCHVGPLPFLQVSVVSARAPVFRTVWLAPSPESESVREAAGPIRSSRAPPHAAVAA